MSWFKKSSQSSGHLKLRQSNERVNKAVNDRGDFLIKESPTRYNLNGDVFHSMSSVAKAISTWGKK